MISSTTPRRYLGRRDNAGGHVRRTTIASCGAYARSRVGMRALSTVLCKQRVASVGSMKLVELLPTVGIRTAALINHLDKRRRDEDDNESTTAAASRCESTNRSAATESAATRNSRGSCDAKRRRPPFAHLRVFDYFGRWRGAYDHGDRHLIVHPAQRRVYSSAPAATGGAAQI